MMLQPILNLHRWKTVQISANLSKGQIAPLLIVFFGGANLILVQWVMVKELTTLLLGTELVVLLTSISYFVGISIGYLSSGSISRRLLPALGAVTLILHLSLPVTFRLIVTWLGVNKAYWAAYLILPILTPFVVSAFYSIFLPLFADRGKGNIGLLYLVEVFGTIFGIVVLFVLGDLGLQPVFIIYSAGLIVLLLSLGISRVMAALLSLVCVIWLAVLPALNMWSNTVWYTQFLGFPEGTTVLFSGYSPYQKVDVLEIPDGERALYLDGLSHFNGAFGIGLNILVGEIPASILRPQSSLVIGAGVMQTEQLIAAYGGQVTTVELDPVVADVGERFFYQYNQMDTLQNRTVFIDDAKHFLANSSSTYDLIVADTPAAFSIQPATLYSVPFYQSVHAHLTDGGLFVGNMTSEFIPGDTVSTRVAASALEVFDEVIVVTPASVGWSFMFAADKLPFTRQELEAALRSQGELQFSIFDTAAVRTLSASAQPITLDSMDFVLQTSVEWISERLSWR